MNRLLRKTDKVKNALRIYSVGRIKQFFVFAFYPLSKKLARFKFFEKGIHIEVTQNDKIRMKHKKKCYVQNQ